MDGDCRVTGREKSPEPGDDFGALRLGRRGVRCQQTHLRAYAQVNAEKILVRETNLFGLNGFNLRPVPEVVLGTNAVPGYLHGFPNIADRFCKQGNNGTKKYRGADVEHKRGNTAAGGPVVSEVGDDDANAREREEGETHNGVQGSPIAIGAGGLEKRLYGRERRWNRREGSGV